MVKSDRRIAVIVCGQPPPELYKLHGTYGPFFEQFLRDSSDEVWRMFDVYKNEFPKSDELRGFDAVIITGSKADAFSDEPWVERARQLVRDCYGRRQRMLGVCFGHQLLAHALGGRAGRAGQWGYGVTQLHLEPQLQLEPWVRGCAPHGAAPAGEAGTCCAPPQLRISSVHQDQVLEVPPGARVLATSKQCPVEIFALGDSVLGIQGHPEFTADTVEGIANYQVEQGIITREMRDAAMASYGSGGLEADTKLLRQWCSAFLA